MAITIYKTVLEVIQAERNKTETSDIYIYFRDCESRSPEWTVSSSKENRNLADFWEKEDAVEYAEFKQKQLEA